MQTRLHLIANETGQFRGIAANYNGPGFSDMHFTTQSQTPAQFEAWVQRVRQGPLRLDQQSYAVLSRPTLGHPIQHYASVEPGLFQVIVDKYEGMNKARGSARQAARADNPLGEARSSDDVR